MTPAGCWCGPGRGRCSCCGSSVAPDLLQVTLYQASGGLVNCSQALTGSAFENIGFSMGGSAAYVSQRRLHTTLQMALVRTSRAAVMLLGACLQPAWRHLFLRFFCAPGFDVLGDAVEVDV